MAALSRLFSVYHLLFAMTLTASLQLKAEFVLQAPSTEAYAVLSDLDDTIKVTNVPHPMKALYNILFSDRVFIGVPEYFTQLDTPHFFILSGSGEALRKKIEGTLNKNGIRQPTELILNSTTEDTKEYKKKALNTLLTKYKLPMVLIGDDTQYDPEVYADFAAKYPDKVLAIYIRRITGREIPAGSTHTYTTYEFANNEYAAGRLSYQAMHSVGQSFLKVKKPTTVFPKFAKCPKKTEQVSTPYLDEVSIAVRDHIVKLCVERKKANDKLKGRQR